MNNDKRSAFGDNTESTFCRDGNIDNYDEKIKKLERIADDVMKLARSSLVVDMRFLDTAVFRLKLSKKSDSGCVATDGESFFYDPIFLLKGYRSNNTLPNRQLLHSVFHCIYRHMYSGNYMNRRIWDIACDIAVENIIDSLTINCISNDDRDEQKKECAKLGSKVKYCTAEMLYRCLLDSSLDENSLQRLERLFRVDDHSIWYSAQINSASDGRRFPGQKSPAEMKRIWKDVSERVETALETIDKQRGVQTSDMLQNLREVNRERYDYSKLLKRFAVTGEAMKINDDEFDYIFYSYGLSLYGNMPLVEPLEYKETKRIRDFVIAIDTSQSVSGETVQRFIQKTYNILKSTESFFTRVNIHIIQCDYDIKTDDKITSLAELESYFKNMKLHGFGGTDFRPVFEYVDELAEKGEFSQLGGLLYFTDGFGEFPARPPKYKTAFVYIDEELNNYNVPSWAIKIILSLEDIDNEYKDS